jgi:outer membrane biosynthesis protein TonB
MNNVVGNAIGWLALIALLVVFTQAKPKEPVKENLDQLLDNELFIDQLAEANTPKETSEPEVVPLPEEKKEEVKPSENLIPEFRQYEPKRRFFFRRGINYELSRENFCGNIRHASQPAYFWDY